MLNLTLCAVFAVLIFAVFTGSETQKAQALSALTITDKSTFTSLTSGSWQRVWTNTAGTATYFTDTSGTNFKSVLLNTTGSVTQTVTGALVGGAVTVTSETGSTTKIDTLFKQDLGGTTQALLTGGVTTVGEKIGAAASLLAGQVVNSCTVSIKKTGAPTGTAIIAIMNAAGTTQYQCGTQDVSLLTTSFQSLTYTGTAAPYTIANGDLIGVFFNSGSAGNTLDVEYENANVFDGTTNSIQQDCTGTQGALTCTNRTTRELRLALSYVYQASYANDGVLTTYWENGAYVVRAVQSDNDQVTSLRSGSTVAACEKVTATSALIGASVDTLDVSLAKTGSPTGTITAGVYNNVLSLQYTFNTMAAASLTTSQAIYSFASGTDRTLASGDYVCIAFSGGSVGNTVDAASVSLNPYDGTNSVLTTFTGTTPTDTGTADFKFRLVDSAVNDQESGAFLKWNAGSAVGTGGVKVYWTDTAKIPASIKLSTSTDDISYTDRVTITPTVATGYEYLELDASYSVQYVKLTVVTWGSANSMAITEMQRLPTGAGSGWLSAIESSAGVQTQFYAAFGAANTEIYAGQINDDNGAILQSATFTTDAYDDVFAITASKNALYIITKDGAFVEYKTSTRALASFTETGSLGGTLSGGAKCQVTTDGAAAANDIYYCLLSITSGTKFAKYSGATLAFISGQDLDGATAGSSLSLSYVSGKVVGQALISSTVKSAYITLSTDTRSTILTNTWLTLQTQQFDFTGSVARTFKASSKLYYATSGYAISYAASTGTETTQDALYIETASAGTMTGIDDPAWYRLSNTLIASGSGTTWTPRYFPSSVQITPTPKTELLNVALQTNYTIFSAGVLKINCNYIYPLLNTKTHYVGSDSDCATWLIVPTSSDTVGRLLDYSRTSTLVHANPMTAYTIQLSASSPDLYSIETQYLTTPVDSGAFDSGGALNQYLLFGNCYVMEIIEESTGNTLQTGVLCANGVTTKTISLSGITIPSDWQSATWSHIISRNFTNPTNNGITFTFAKSTTPYNASLYVYNNALSTPTFTQWYNFTNVSGTSVANVTGQNSNQTLYFELYENDALVIQDVSSPESLAFDPFPASIFGHIFGLSAGMIFPVLTAAIFPKSLAYFGSIVTVAVIGLLAVFGIYTPPVWFWGLIMPVLAISVFVGYKRT